MGSIHDRIIQNLVNKSENFERDNHAMARTVKIQRQKVRDMRSELHDMWEEDQPEEKMADYTARALREQTLLDGMEMLLACRSDGPEIEEIIKELVEQ